MEASFISATSFEVQGDFTTIFLENRRIKANCGLDGYKYGTVSASSEAGGVTTVSLTTGSDDLTANLTDIAWGRNKPGDEGNIANVWIEGEQQVSLVETGFNKDRAGADASDAFLDFLRRSRGTLETPLVNVTGDYILLKYIQVYLQSAFRSGFVNQIMIDEIVTTHPILKEIIYGDAGTGLVEIFNKFGDGIFSFPLQSYAKANRATTQIIASGGAGDKFQYNVEVDDNQDEFDSVTGYDFTAKRAGVFHVVAQVTMAAAANDGIFKIILKLGTGTTVAQRTFIKDVTDSNITLAVETDVALDVGDSLEVYVYHNAGLGIGSTAEDTENFICIRKVL